MSGGLAAAGLGLWGVSGSCPQGQEQPRQQGLVQAPFPCGRGTSMVPRVSCPPHKLASSWDDHRRNDSPGTSMSMQDLPPLSLFFQE